MAGDFTGNGHLDLAVADRMHRRRHGAPGQRRRHVPGPGADLSRDATFSVGRPIRCRWWPGDFRNNGLTDLAVATTDFFDGDSVDVLLGNGDGTFQAPDVISLGLWRVSRRDCRGRLHRQRHPRPGHRRWQRRLEPTTTRCTWATATARSSPRRPTRSVDAGSSTAIVTGDFTGNGRTDLAIARTNPDDVQVQLSNGDGTFSEPVGGRPRPSRNAPGRRHQRRRHPRCLRGRCGRRHPLPRRAGRASPAASRLPSRSTRATRRATSPSSRPSTVPTIASVDADDNAISFFVLRSTGFVLVGKLATGSEPAADPRRPTWTATASPI